MTSSCPYCRAPFEVGDDLTACSGCGTAHHTDCLAENGGCTVFGCSQAPVEEAKISVTTTDVNSHTANAGYPIFYPPQPQPGYAVHAPAAQQVTAPYSFLNLQMPPEPVSVAPVISGIAPPPRPDGQIGPDGWSAAPPPTPVLFDVNGAPIYPAYPDPSYQNSSYMAAPYPVSGYPQPAYPPQGAYPTFAGYAPAPSQTPYYPGYEPRKSRVVFVMLAVFLGPFGGHNFYAGFVTKAVIQLCVTILTCFLGAAVSWIWAIVEACIIDHDNNGVAFV